MKYIVEITETLKRHFIVEAESFTAAEGKVIDAYNEEEITLDYRNYDDTNVVCLRKADEHDVEYYEEL